MHLEHLETRLALAAGITWDARQGTLAIVGSAGSDVAEVHRQGTAFVATVTNDSGTVSRAVPAARVRAIAFSGLDGNDTFTNSTQVRSVADGGAGDDVLAGGGGNDRLVGGDGNDRLSGNAGADVLIGGAHADTLLGGAGNDTVSGGIGDDSVDGGEGNDVEDGNEGDDLVYGGNGNDVLRGSVGNDQLFGNTGGDRVFGDAGDDLLNGGGGRDVLVGGAGNDHDTDPEDNLADRNDDAGAEGEDDVEGDQMSGAGMAGTSLAFDPQGYAYITDTSANRRDAKVYTFTATLDGMVSVAIGENGGRAADLEVVNSRSRTLLELEPQDNRVYAGNFNVMSGERYTVIVRSHDLGSVGIAVRLRQHTMSGGSMGMM
jgi:hypothetical protein